MNLIVSLFIFVVEVLVVTLILIIFLKRQLKTMGHLKRNYELYRLDISPFEELASFRGFVSSLKLYETLINDFDSSIDDKEILEKDFRKVIYEYPKKYVVTDF